MDPFSKKLFREFEEMHQTAGRLMRNMSLSRMVRVESGHWQPPVDIYESADELLVFFDLAGVDKNSLELVVEEQQLTISGCRQLPKQKSIACVHQLEIELGGFQRTVPLPVAIDVDRAVSSYEKGIVTVTLAKKTPAAKVTVTIKVDGLVKSEKSDG
ncbi:MAG: Hsp20/alpha crystallin family protein [Thermodesulfobacteriota bacterium]